MSQNNVYTEPEPLAKDIPLRIYSNPICPYVQRVRLLVAAKGVKSEEVNIHLKAKPEWYLQKVNPMGQVPTIEHNGHYIRESLIAFDYIDEVFGEESIWPKDPFLKAQARLLVNDFGNKFTPNYYKHYRLDTVTEKDTDEVIKFLVRMEEVLSAESSGYFWGMDGKPGAADFLVWPWIERLEMISTYCPAMGERVTKDKFPGLFDYIERMKKNEAVKLTFLATEVHLAFLKHMMTTGRQDYSLTGKDITIYTKKED